MTYRELLYKAHRLINQNKITLGEYDEMTKPLDREIEERKVGKWLSAEEYALKVVQVLAKQIKGERKTLFMGLWETNY